MATHIPFSIPPYHLSVDVGSFLHFRPPLSSTAWRRQFFFFSLSLSLAPNVHCLSSPNRYSSLSLAEMFWYFPADYREREREKPVGFCFFVSSSAIFLSCYKKNLSLSRSVGIYCCCLDLFSSLPTIFIRNCLIFIFEQESCVLIKLDPVLHEQIGQLN